MAEAKRSQVKYDRTIVTVSELIWGEGFLAPGGSAAVHPIVKGLDLQDRTVLDIGCGVGGVDRVLAEDHGCLVIGLDIVPLLIDIGRARMDKAGLADRVDLRLVEPGPLPLEDHSVDVVFGKDSWLLIDDKPAFFAEVVRVLKPGGTLAASEWMGDGQSPSPAMQTYFDLRGMSYELVTAETYGRLLADAGLTGVAVSDTSATYRAEARREHNRLKGALREPMIDVLGPDKQAHFVTQWDAMCKVLDLGELRTGHLRARKPD
ncbi:MAG: methyltransferase domain-containing protein [Pseudomonadota bacterium]|nr:methyltransferase domain-containing protein [Pseudomonadota bacterium]